MDEENKESEENKLNGEYIPEQLEDNDFEKEKEELKKMKKQKKLEKKLEKQKRKGINSSDNEETKDEEVKYDEDGNIILEPKKSKKKLIIIIVSIILILAVIGGLVAYFYISFNRPENIILDCASYFNEKDWDKYIDCIDFKGYYALGGFYLQKDEYNKFDEVYDKIEDQDTYEVYKNLMDQFLKKKDKLLDTMAKDVTINVTDVESKYKIENTKSLYKVRVKLKVSYQGQTEEVPVDFYVTKIDGKYKIVEGYFPYIIGVQIANYFYMYNNNLEGISQDATQDASQEEAQEEASETLQEATSQE